MLERDLTIAARLVQIITAVAFVLVLFMLVCSLIYYVKNVDKLDRAQTQQYDDSLEVKEVKYVKDLGWDKLFLSQKGFKGAVQSYKSNNGNTVALAFNLHEAFIVEDEQGLYGVEDLEKGIIKAKDINIENTGRIKGAYVVAWHDEETGEIGFDEEKLTELGINDFLVKDSLKIRLLVLSLLDK